MPASHAMSRTRRGRWRSRRHERDPIVRTRATRQDRTDRGHPKAEEGPARCPAARFHFLLYPFVSRIFISAQPEEAALASIHAKQPARINESSRSSSCVYRVGLRGFLNQASQRDRSESSKKRNFLTSPTTLLTGNGNQVHDNNKEITKACHGDRYGTEGQDEQLRATLTTPQF